MIKIKLPDNSIMEFDAPVSGMDIAKKLVNVWLWLLLL